jgi:hypothetical protein
MRRKAAALAIVVGICFGVALPSTQARDTVATKKCKVVVKKVRGKMRKVRVCKKVKPPALKKVSLKLDTSRRGSAALTVTAGGKVSATTAKGLKLTLSVPKDALAADTTVRLTPVKSIGGLTGKLVTAVQLEPEGLVLAKPATLTIEGARTSGRLTGLAWIGQGKYAQRYALAKSGGRLLFSILHFSGAGAYQGPIGGLPAVRDTQIAFYKNVLLPKLNQAQDSDSAFQQAVALDLSWERGFELIGDKSFMSEERAHAKKLIKQAFLKQVDRAYESCKSKHDVGKELRNLVAYARQAEGGAALLLENAQAAKEIEDLANEDAGKCGSFQLDFETNLSGTNTFEGSDFTEDWSLHVRVLSLPVHAVGSTIDLTVPPPVTKQLEYLSFTYTSTSTGACQFTATGVQLGGPFSVQRLDLAPDDSAVTMDLSFGTPTERVQCGSNPEQVTTVYQTMLQLLHQSESSGATVHVAGWSILGGSVYARKTYSGMHSFPQTGITYTVTEQTTFDLRHTPE